MIFLTRDQRAKIEKFIERTKPICDVCRNDEPLLSLRWGVIERLVFLELLAPVREEECIAIYCNRCGNLKHFLGAVLDRELKLGLSDEC